MYGVLVFSYPGLPVRSVIAHVMSIYPGYVRCPCVCAPPTTLANSRILAHAQPITQKKAALPRRQRSLELLRCHLSRSCRSGRSSCPRSADTHSHTKKRQRLCRSPHIHTRGFIVDPHTYVHTCTHRQGPLADSDGGVTMAFSLGAFATPKLPLYLPYSLGLLATYMYIMQCQSCIDALHANILYNII